MNTAAKEARAFRIWRFCKSHEWDCTPREIAAGLSLTIDVVRRTLRERGWSDRLEREQCAQIERRRENLSKRGRGLSYDDAALDLVEIFS